MLSDIFLALLIHHVLSCLSEAQFCVCVCSQLRDAFVYQMTQGFSHFDRQLRNDLLVIISLVSAAAADVPYVQSGLAKHLALFATFQEGNFSLSKLFAINSVDC